MADDDAVTGAAPVGGEVLERAYDGPGEWLKARQAAIRLGISDRTLWRRVNEGKLKKRLERNQAEVYVPLDGVAGTPPVIEQQMAPAPTWAPLAVLDELEALRARVVALERENAVLSHQVARRPCTWRQWLAACLDGRW